MKKTLTESNRHLRSSVERERGQWLAAKSSSAIEGIRVPFKARAGCAASGNHQRTDCPRQAPAGKARRITRSNIEVSGA